MDGQSRSTRTWISALAAGLIAFLLFMMFGVQWLIALIVGVVVFALVLWWLQQRGSSEDAHDHHASSLTPTAPVTPEPVVPPTRPVAPAPPPAASPVGEAVPAAGTGMSERVRDAARAAGEAARAAGAPAAAGSAAPLMATGGEASKPTGLAAPRTGGGDDLRKIKGVGPKLETLLHSLGIYHFDQMAVWTPAELAWIDSNLDGFNGRAVRDDWVGQAKILAAGGTTEHGKVERGEI